jgi:hypothetical protein
MNALGTLAWAIIAAVTAWGLTLARASIAIARIEAACRKEIRHWQAEAARARAHAAQLAQDAATWSAGCKQGRDDVINIMPLLTAANERRMDLRRAAGDMTDRT